MATRRRTLLFTCALGFSAVLAPAAAAGAAGARLAQDPGATFGGAGAETSTTVVATTSPATTATTEATNQTLVESEDTPDKPVFTENRKVAAVIGGLVFVALALLLLTIRYIRVTKPSSTDDVDPAIPMLPIDLDLNDDSIFIDDDAPAAPPWPPRSPVVPAAEASAEAPDDASTDGAEATSGAVPAVMATAPGTDHDAADEDWEPRTGEHDRVEIPSGATMARPGVAARRKALGVDPG